MRVVGLDLSLTGTGIAVVDDGPGQPSGIITGTVNPGKRREYERLRFIREQVIITCMGADLVVVEGPSFGSTGSAYHQIAGLWWFVTECVQRDLPLAVASPSSVKKYATGKGNANKDAMMLVTARRFPEFNGDNNAADALWMACMGMDHLGRKVTSGISEALEKVTWP
jgi:Holliday junction resolvasome RuvABC endonuclease subunit